MDSINERSTWFTTVSFTDENEVPVIPNSASYRIDDVGTDIEIHGDEDISAIDTSVIIIWTAIDTLILDETHPYETRRLTVSWKYNTSTSPSVEAEGHFEYLLNVKNLKGVTTPSPA